MFAIWGGSFLEPDPFNYFFGAGLGTNLGASVVWGFLAGFLGYFLARKVKRAWRRLHARLDEHHRTVLEHDKRVGSSLAELHEKHDERHEQLAAQVATLAERQAEIAGLLSAVDTRLATGAEAHTLPSPRRSK
jgi:vacuolar-type H+-ATPase subunit I/STV1